MVKQVGEVPVWNLCEQGSWGAQAPEAVSNLVLLVYQASPNWGISAITQTYLTTSPSPATNFYVKRV